jgi:hypothetical protein
MIYQDAKKHFEGHEARYVIYHHQNLQKSHPSPRLSFRSDAVKLEDLIRRVEDVTHQPLTDIYKLAAFFTRFHKDARPGVAIRIQTTMLIKVTYAMTSKSVCDMTAFDDTPHHHALAITKSTANMDQAPAPSPMQTVATSIVVKLAQCHRHYTTYHTAYYMDFSSTEEAIPQPHLATPSRCYWSRVGHRLHLP